MPNRASPVPRKSSRVLARNNIAHQPVPIPPLPTLLVISQVYVPDPASVGQHMADAAETMVARGFRVLVLASARGYENPSVRYPRAERRGGVDVVRLPLSSFGKRSLPLRLLGQGLFLLQVIMRGLFVRRMAGILVSRSPPMASFAALAISLVRGVPITYWLMDLNPDQAASLGKTSARSPFTRAMRWLNRRIYARAREVVVLDRFMIDRIERQYPVRGRITVLPPWPHDEALADVGPGSNPFRAEHNPQERFVVMYSGNHSLASPITTLLEAALWLRQDPRFLFMFIGGGLGKREVDEAIAIQRPANIVSLPYQPLERIQFSLSAADLHVVTLGNDMPGIIHPCKIYGAMAVGRPILLIGPRRSHAGDLIDRFHVGWQVDQGDVATTIAVLEQVASMAADKRDAIGARGRTVVRERFAKSRLCAEFCDVVERSMAAAPAREDALVVPAANSAAAATGALGPLSSFESLPPDPAVAAEVAT